VSTLNYWLGKLQRLQLFGHGVKEIRVVLSGVAYKITYVDEVDGTVYIEIKE